MNVHTDKKEQPSVTLRRREREKAQRERIILRAAERVFARKGFQGATIQEIAAESELAVGTIYNFFSSKEALYSRIITSRLSEMRQEVLGKTQGISDVRQRLRSMLELQSAFIEKNRDFFIIFLRDHNRYPWSLAKDLGEEVFHRYQRYLETLRLLFKEGIQRGIFREHNPEDLAEAWGGLCNTFFYKWLLERPPWDLKTKSKTIYELFMRGIER